ncbi:hypothetical protein H0H93_010401 [Arthromyces matolae]|nr:hypothetical protein H0H93_010401 [Arthromyces matolae]
MPSNDVLNKTLDHLVPVPDAPPHMPMPPDPSPPSTPSSPNPDTTLSRKREREVSLEPASTPQSTITSYPGIPQDIDNRKDTRTPAKKNRTHLDATEEEDDVTQSRSDSGSPPLSTSPQNEMKIGVRQISQGVEDISWRNMNAVTPDRDVEADPSSETPALEDNQVNDEDPQLLVDSEATESAPVEMMEFDTGDKSLKRKLSERGTSQGPPDTAQSAPEPLKRPRDDNKDENPREAKRPSPPPEPRAPKSPKKAPATVSTAPLSGFMAYASPNSPFSAVKGQNVFAANKAASPPPSNPHTPAPSLPDSSNHQSGDTPPTAPVLKRTGFEAFASSASPFASASRSKSPVLGSTSKLGRARSPPRRGNSITSNAFASYADGLQGFAIPPPKRARAGTPNNALEGPSSSSVFGNADDRVSDSGDEDTKDDDGSFGARLRASKDQDDESIQAEPDNVYNLTEQDVLTGEEDEQTVHQVRGKLFSLVDGTQWKERGTGTLKLNVKRSDGSGARLVMRKEAVYTLLLNVTLFHGMRCTLAQDPRYLRLSVIENGVTTHYNLRLANAKIAKELLEEVLANIPSA